MNTDKLISIVDAAVRAQGKASAAIAELVTNHGGIAALQVRAERYADIAGSPSCDEVKRLRALIRKAGAFMEGGQQGTYRLAAEGEEGAPLTVKFRDRVASIEFAASRKPDTESKLDKALAAYVKACKEAGVELEQAQAMVAGEWHDSGEEVAEAA